MAMTLSQLNRHANKFLGENYGMKMEIPLKLNGRLSVACGRFRHYNVAGRPLDVELNKKFVENNADDVVLDVLYHELVHYALYMKNRDYRDGQSDFENELKRLGILSQSNIATKHKIVAIYHIYLCKVCNKEHPSKRRLHGDGAKHKCRCGGHIKNIGQKSLAL